MEVDWTSLLGFDTPIVETVIRGSVMYLGVFFLVRGIMGRPTGQRSMSELLVVVLLADASQNGMAGDYSSITSGLVLVATIMGWNWLLDVLAFHFRPIERLVAPSPLLIVEDGHPIAAAMRRENVSQEELNMMLRIKGVEDIAMVREARLEGLGGLSVSLKDSPAGGVTT